MQYSVPQSSPSDAWIQMSISILYRYLSFAMRQILFCAIQAHPVLSFPILYKPVLPYPFPVLSFPFLYKPVLSYPFLSYTSLSCPILSCPTEYRPVMSCPVLSFPALFSLVTSFPTPVSFKCKAGNNRRQFDISPMYLTSILSIVLHRLSFIDWPFSGLRDKSLLDFVFGSTSRSIGK